MLFVVCCLMIGVRWLLRVARLLVVVCVLCGGVLFGVWCLVFGVCRLLFAVCCVLLAGCCLLIGV